MKMSSPRETLTTGMLLTLSAIAAVTNGIGCGESAARVGELVIGAPAASAIAESGTQTTLTVALSARPRAVVRVPVASSDATEGAPGTSLLEFTEENWNAPQTVVVTGVDDLATDGEQTFHLAFGPSESDDAAFVGLIASSSDLTTRDDETAGFEVNVLDDESSEAGGSASFTVRLSSAPSSTVTVTLTSEDSTEGSLATSTLVFTTENWNAPQTVIVAGEDDELADGRTTFAVSFVSIESLDVAYATTALPGDVVLANADDETAGITLLPMGGSTTSESGAPAMFTIVLDAEPSANVTVGYASADTTEGVATSSSVVFTPASWNAPQVVTVNGVDDELADGMQPYAIAVVSVESDDAAYSDLAPLPSITFANLDDDSAGITVTRVTHTTTEAGDAATFTVVLNSEPSANVSLAYMSSAFDEGTVAPAGLVFTPTNWNAPQSVTVTGQNDDIADGGQSFSIVFTAPTSADAGYATLAAPEDLEFTNTDDDSAGITVVATTSSETTEAQGTATFTVKLNSEPTSNVTISLASSEPGEGLLSPTSIEFTPLNWNSPRSVTVTGQDDLVVDGNQPYVVTFAQPTSADSAYANLAAPASIDFMNIDNDTVGLSIITVASLTTTEAGGTATFTVALTLAPTSDVTVTYTSSAMDEGAPSPASLTFTPLNWQAPQTVTLVGLDDFIADGNQPYTISFAPLASADTGFDGLVIARVLSATNTDDDSAGITLMAAPTLSTSESGGSSTFTVVLNSEPTADVLIDCASSALDEGLVSPTTLVFTAANWNAPQTVTVTGQNDDVADGGQLYRIDFTAPVSADSAYAALGAPQSVPLTNTDDDSAGFTVTSVPGLTTTEAGGTATFTVALNSQPTANVTLVFASSAADEGISVPGMLVFTPSNWNQPRTVTVTGQNDDVADGGQPYTVFFGAPTSADPAYASLPAPSSIAFTNTDNDSPGVTALPGLNTITTESGGFGTFTLVLNSQPIANVTISFTSNAPDEGIASPSSVTFTPSNWNTVRTVTVTGQNDALTDGNQAYSIVFNAPTSSDPGYNSLPPPASITFTNADTAAPRATNRVQVKMANTSQSTISFGGYLNGESFQQDGILTYNGYQYAAYWNNLAKVVLARRALGTGEWSKIDLDPEYVGTSGDAHNTISLGVSVADGRLHVAFDHHGNDLRYNYSVAGLLSNPGSVPWATASFQPSPTSYLGGTFVSLVTYPRFVTTPSGKLLLSYRYGTSGSGDEVLWEYDGANSTWTSIGTYISGIPQSVNAYLHGLEYSGARLHAAWCWRDTPNASTNHGLFYIYSDDDGRTWRDNTGAVAAVTGTTLISLNSAGIEVWPISQNRGLINQEHMTVDNAGRVHVLLSHMPDAQANDSNFTSARTKSQFFHYWRETNGTWHRTAMGFPVIANFRGKFAVSSTNNLYAVLPNLRIASASAETSWSNWTLLETTAGYFSDPLIDRARLRLENVLTIFAPSTNSDPAVPIYTINYDIE